MRVIGLQLLLVGMLLPLDTRQRGNIQLGSRPGAQYTEFAANMDRNGTGICILARRIMTRLTMWPHVSQIRSKKTRNIERVDF